MTDEQLAGTVGGVFDGIGLLAYGLHRAGWRHSWLCEVDPWRREILERRWPGVAVVDDVRAVGADAVPRVELLAGGFPCKGASTAGKRTGFDHPETVLWREMARAIGELRPRYVLVENVANLLAVRDGAVWGEVLGDLASLGFDVVWDCFPAAAFGAPHLRDRVIAIATYAGDDDRWADEGSRDNGHGSHGQEGQWFEGADQHGTGNHDAPNPECGGLREQPEPKPGSGRKTIAGRSGEDDADASQGRREGQPAVNGAEPSIAASHAGRLGVPVEWGEYEPAIRRWEKVVGRAPEPLCAFRGVDARRASRVERSRLSALGDGVQVQLGELAGRYIMQLASASLASGRVS